MSEMLIGVLRMPPELFWSDDEMTRLQHDNIRREAADEIERLQAECEKLRCIISDIKDWDCDVSGGFLSIPVGLRRRIQDALAAYRK